MFVKIDEVFYNIEYIKCVRDCTDARGTIRIYFDGMPDLYTNQYRTAAELIRKIAKIHRIGEGDTK